MKPSLIPTLQAMAAAGCTAEQIVAVVQAHAAEEAAAAQSLEAEAAAALAAKRAKNAERVRRQRARNGEPHNADVRTCAASCSAHDASCSAHEPSCSAHEPLFSEKDNSHPVPPQDIGPVSSEKEKDCQMAAGDVPVTAGDVPVTFGHIGSPSPKKERSPPNTPSKEKITLSLPLYNNPPTARARKPDPATPRAILEEALPADLADAVIRHRQALRKPLTAKASELLVRSLRDTGDPRAAAEMMIERGWQTIRPDWYENSKHSRGNYGIREDKSTVAAARRLVDRLRAAEQRGEDVDILGEYGGRASAPAVELLPPRRGG